MTQKEQVIESTLYKRLGRDNLINLMETVLNTIDSYDFICNKMEEEAKNIIPQRLLSSFAYRREFIDIFRPPSAYPPPPENNTAFWDTGKENLPKRKRVIRRIIKVLKSIEENR